MLYVVVSSRDLEIFPPSHLVEQRMSAGGEKASSLSRLKCCSSDVSRDKWGTRSNCFILLACFCICVWRVETCVQKFSTVVTLSCSPELRNHFRDIMIRVVWKQKLDRFIHVNFAHLLLGCHTHLFSACLVFSSQRASRRCQSAGLCRESFSSACSAPWPRNEEYPAISLSCVFPTGREMLSPFSVFFLTKFWANSSC